MLVGFPFLAACISIHAPLAGCDILAPCSHKINRYFNPRTPCGVRRCACARKAPQRISIHAPLAGCDQAGMLVFAAIVLFQSTHPLRGATCLRTLYSLLSRFQSTHPLRGATLSLDVLWLAAGYFNPRTPCGVRPPIRSMMTVSALFQSTHPLRGATVSVVHHHNI